MNVTIDDKQVRRVFRQLPTASLRALNGLIETGAIDTQREMRREVNVGATGDGRRAIKYRLYPATLSAEVVPDFPYAEPLEKGSRPHPVSVKPGTSLYRWAIHKGINPYAVRASIMDHLAGRLAKFKWPRSIDFVDELPREPTGKLLKRTLRDPYWADRQTAI